MNTSTLLCAAVALFAAGSAFGAQIEITERESSAGFENPVDGGVLQINWVVGGVDHLAAQDFYLAVGDDGSVPPTTSLTALSSLPESDLFIDDAERQSGRRVVDPAQLIATYEFEGIKVIIDYDLTGASSMPSNPGDTVQSSLKVNVTLENTTDSDKQFRFRQYTDFNLAGNETDVSVSSPELGGFGGIGVQGLVPNTVTQTDVNVVVSENFTDATGGVGTQPRPAEFAYGQQAGVLADVQDVSPLDGVIPPTFFDDLAWAFGWEGNLAAAGTTGSIYSINKDLQVTFTLGQIIPAPGTLAFGVLGGLATARRRR